MSQAVRGMGLFERVRRLLKPKQMGSVPIEVSAALVDDLYSNLMSFTIAATTAVLLGGIVASRTGSPSLIFLTVATAAVAAARALLVIEYYKHKSSSQAIVPRCVAGNDGTQSVPWPTVRASEACASLALCSSTTTLPVAVWYLRGRIYGRDYGA